MPISNWIKPPMFDFKCYLTVLGFFVWFIFCFFLVSQNYQQTDKIDEAVSWEISWALIWFCNLNLFKGFYSSCVRGMVIMNQTVVNPRPLMSTWNCWTNPWLIACVNGCRSWWPEGQLETDGGLKDSRLQNAEISASRLTTRWKLQMFMKMAFKICSGSCCSLSSYWCSER